MNVPIQIMRQGNDVVDKWKVDQVVGELGNYCGWLTRRPEGNQRGEDTAINLSGPAVEDGVLVVDGKRRGDLGWCLLP